MQGQKRPSLKWRGPLLAALTGAVSMAAAESVSPVAERPRAERPSLLLLAQAEPPRQTWVAAATPAVPRHRPTAVVPLATAPVIQPVIQPVPQPMAPPLAAAASPAPGAGAGLQPWMLAASGLSAMDLAELGLAALPGIAGGDNLQTAPAYRQLALAIAVNGLPKGESLLLRDGAGRFLAMRDDLTAWGLRVPDAVSVVEEDVDFYRLDALPGYAGRYDSARQFLDLQFAASAFLGGTAQAVAGRLTRIDPVGFGGFVNYDFFASQSKQDGRGADDLALNGFAEAVIYNPWGTFTSSFVGQGLTQPANGPRGRTLRRLESAWRTDFLDQTASLTLGDAVGISGYWAQPVRYGGVRFGTNFETQPGFVYTPQLVFAGEAAVPSVVDVFINGSRQQSVQVPSGPFQITDVPTISGSGEARLVVRDVLGREQVLVQSFLTSTQQLRQGVSEYSIEVGGLRRDIGVRNYGYGPTFGLAHWRYGVSQNFTGEVRMEGYGEGVTSGVGGTYTQGELGAISLALANNQRAQQRGSLLFVGIERPSRGRGLFLAGSGRWTQRDFRQVGNLEADLPPPSSTVALNVGLPITSRSTASLGWVSSRPRTTAPTQVFTASVGSVYRGLFGSLSASRQLSDRDTTSILATLSCSFGNRRSVSGSLSRSQSEGVTTLLPTVQVQQSLAQGPGYGWRALAAAPQRSPGDDSERYEVGASARTNYFSVAGDVGRANDTTAARASLQGAFGLVGGRPFVTREVRQSFGVIDDPALADLPVFVNGQLAARTDARGHALLPQLQPFLENTIRVDLEEAPYDLVLDSPSVKVVAGNRTGHTVAFKAQRLQGVMLNIVTGNGKPAPLGARISIEGVTDTYYVAENGEAFAAFPVGKTVVAELRWRGQQCRFTLSPPAALADDLPVIGPIPCPEILP